MNSSRLLLCALLCLAAPARAAEEVAVVLSAGGGAYLEAFSAFQAAYGPGVHRLDAAHGCPVLPQGVGTVVAFGTKAASLQYPPELNLVYALAPGFFLPAGGRTGRTVKISMRASPRYTLARLLEIQPGIKKLSIFWATPGYAPDMETYRAAGSELGLAVTPVRVEEAAQLPRLLRAASEAEAFWLPPDPLLISPDTLLLFREFSWGNGIPMYTSTRGLAREGACASVGVSFQESGAAAAAAVKALQAGETPPALIFPDRVELTLNTSAARRCGVKFSPEILKQAATIFP